MITVVLVIAVYAFWDNYILWKKSFFYKIRELLRHETTYNFYGDVTANHIGNYVDAEITKILGRL